MKRIRIFGEEYEVRARILRLEATSGHADRNELLEWARATSYHGQLRQIALVHSELASSRPFAELLRENGLGPVMIPAKGDSLPLD